MLIKPIYQQKKSIFIRAQVMIPNKYTSKKKLKFEKKRTMLRI